MALDDFITHSDYPMEKIIWAYEAIIDSNNEYWGDALGDGLYIPVPRTIKASNLLLDGVWTTDNWQTSYPINTNGRVFGWKEDDGTYYTSYDMVSAGVITNVYTITEPTIMVNASVDSVGTPKVRLFAYLTASDTTSTVEDSTASQLAYSLQKNTELAQLNLLSENDIIVPANTDKIIYHGLGFRPFCTIWKRNNQGTWSKNTWIASVESGVEMVDSTITITEGQIKIHAYDIYGDGDSQEFLIRIFNYAT